LAKFQDIQSKARNEIQLILKDENPTYKNVQHLDYLLCIIKEGMRLHNPVESVPERITTKDVILEGYHIPKGSNIGINITAIHQSKQVYGDPENFRPERWTPEEQEKRKIPSSAWIPFSGGSRVCIGNNFSIIEQKIFLSEILSNYTISLVNKNDIIEQDPQKNFLSGPKNIPIKFTSIQ
jgi:cytochrome P450